MMVAIFASMMLALFAARWAPRWLAVAVLLVCFVVAMGEFLWEVYSPVDGFRLPWLQGMIQPAINGRPA